MPSVGFSPQTETFLRDSLKRGYRSRLSERWTRWLKTLEPPAALTVSQHADAYCRLITASGRTVRWTTREPQRAILDAFDNDRIEEINVLKSSRFGWTSILMCAMDYFIAHDPSPIAMVQPRMKDMEEWSKDQVQPTIDASEILSQLVARQRAGSSGNTIDHKEYPGGPLRLRASNSPDGFRRWAARVGMCDEIDGYPLSAGKEGDVPGLLWTRLQDAWNRVLANGSTPTEVDISAIWRRFNESSRGYPFLTCPHCGEPHIRLFRQPREPIVLQGVERPVSILNWDAAKPSTAHYVCPANGCVITHKHHHEMLNGCYWIGDHWEYREREYQFLDGFEGRIGFATWAGYVISPNTTPAKLAARWERDKRSPESKKVFVNTVEGLPWEEEGEELRSAILIARKEPFTAEVPAGGLYLSVGIDVQASPARWELEVVAWGLDEESWSVDYQIVFGDTSLDRDWEEILKPYIEATYRHESGLELPISAIGIDHGFESKRVETFINRLRRANVYAFKGMPGEGRPIVETDRGRHRRLLKARRGKFKPELLGDHQAKKTILDRLRKIDAPGAGYSHFPLEREDEYFEQLTAEKLVTRYRHGRAYREWIKLQERNEALDCRKLAYAAFLVAAPNLEREQARLQATQQAGHQPPSSGLGAEPLIFTADSPLLR